MKYVVALPQYGSGTFRFIGKFNDEKSAHKFIEDYFQDDGDYEVVPYNKKIHENPTMEDIKEKI